MFFAGVIRTWSSLRRVVEKREKYEEIIQVKGKKGRLTKKKTIVLVVPIQFREQNLCTHTQLNIQIRKFVSPNLHNLTAQVEIINILEVEILDLEGKDLKIKKLTLASDETKVSHFIEYDSTYSYDSEEIALALVSSRLIHFVSDSLRLIMKFCRYTFPDMMVKQGILSTRQNQIKLSNRQLLNLCHN